DAPEGAVRIVGVLGGESLENDTGLAPDQVGFEGDAGQTMMAATADGPVLWVGLGEETDSAGLRDAMGAAARALPDGRSAVTPLHQLDVDGALQAVITGFRLGSYRFQAYRSKEPSPDPALYLHGEGDEQMATRSETIVDATLLAREWVNRPPADKAPDALANEMSDHLAGAGFDVDVWDEERIAGEKLGGLLGVAAGSRRPPRMLVARRHVEGAPDLALVGKCIT